MEQKERLCTAAPLSSQVKCLANHLQLAAKLLSVASLWELIPSYPRHLCSPENGLCSLLSLVTELTQLPCSFLHTLQRGRNKGACVCTFQVVESIQELPVFLGVHLPAGLPSFQLEGAVTMSQRGAELMHRSTESLWRSEPASRPAPS